MRAARALASSCSRRRSATADGEPLIRANAWRLATRPTEMPRRPRRRAEPLPGPSAATHEAFFDTGQDVGYHTAMEYRFSPARFTELGPALVWMRMRHPLVAGEEPSPLQRVLIAADSGNGVSATLDLERVTSSSTSISASTCTACPTGEWVGLDAVTLPEPEGVGLADSVLHDERGADRPRAADAARPRALSVTHASGGSSARRGRRQDRARGRPRGGPQRAEAPARCRAGSRGLAEAGDVGAATLELERHQARRSRSSTSTCPTGRACRSVPGCARRRRRPGSSS